MAVPIGKDDEGLGGARAASCASCGATLASSQRYCLECGVRRGPVPAAFVKWLSIVRPDAGSEAATGGVVPDTEEGAAATVAAEGAVFEDSTLAERFMPEPRSAAIATMALLAFGVVVGAATGPLAQSAGVSPIVVEMGSSPSTASSEPEGEASEPIAEAPVESPEATHPPCRPKRHRKARRPPRKTKTEFPEEETLPPVQHVFMIVLGDHGYEEGFGVSSQSTYLSQTLPAKGELLSNYYAVTQGDLANEVALLSGQGPTPATAANCPEYKDVSPGTLSAEGQAEGDGCVYPAEAKTLPGQFVEAKKSWKAYVEDIGNGQAGQSASCRHPALGAPDDAQEPRPGDAYGPGATRSFTSTRSPTVPTAANATSASANSKPTSRKRNRLRPSPPSFPTPATTTEAKCRVKSVSQPGLPAPSPSWKRSCRKLKPLWPTKKAA